MPRPECGLCCKPVNKGKLNLLCCICARTFHRNCTCYSRYETASVHWSCPNCNNEIFPFSHYENDDDFYSAIFDLWSDNCSINFEHLNTLCYSPFATNDEKYHIPIHDHDPDFHYFNHVSQQYNMNCNYFLEETFMQAVPPKSDMSFIHLNIRSSV